MDLHSGPAFWLVSNGLVPAPPRLNGPEHCDIVIIGAGITGALLADALSADGLDVVVLDRREPGLGSTAASTALLLFEIDVELADLVERIGDEAAVRCYRIGLEAIDSLERLSHELGGCGFARRPSLYLASRRRHRVRLAKEADLRQRFHLPSEFWTKAEVVSRYPFSSHGAIWSEAAAQMASRLEPSRRIRTQLEAGAKHLDVGLPHTPIYLDADPVRLEQIFTNLLGNAIKFTHRAGHIWVTAKLQSDRPQMVEIRIRDDGMGISSDLLPRIFDLFIQADSSLERTHGGLGIGLTLVKRMAELHGGTIEARSDGPGHGAEFIVRFPVLGQLPAGVEELPESEAESVTGRDPLRILVVDDNVDAAEVISLLLRHSGHQVSMAHTGASALEEVRLFHPDVVLLDLGLPGMSGYDVARQIRASTSDGQPMLVAVSGFSGDDLQHRMAEAGFDEYIGKPFDLGLLQEVIYRGRA